MKKSTASQAKMLAVAAAMIVLLFSTIAVVSAAVPPVSVVRSAPTTAETGKDVTINLTLNVDEGNLPRAYFLYEYIPADFVIINQGGGTIDTENRRIKWVNLGSIFGGTIQDANFTYKIRSYDTGAYSLKGNGTAIIGTTDIDFTTTGTSSITFTSPQAQNDTDSDGIPNGQDNCPTVANPNQANFDGDAWGDACDPDDDNDGDADTSDCAPLNATRYHGATEICGNGIDENCDGSDAQCGTDSDGDGIMDSQDNCPAIYNPTQANYDGDTMGDACDTDDDNDNDPDTTDCSPLNAAIYHGATEICGNGIDEDCNGLDLVCLGPIESTRTMPATSPANTDFTVNVFVNVNESNKPNSYVLRETIPAGVTLTDLGGGQYDAGSRILKWTIVESAYYGTHVEDRTITYKARSGNSGKQTFDGTVQANSKYYGTGGSKDITISGGQQICIDNDGDGYGSPASSACTYSALDCNDNDNKIYPNAPELCDSKDNQCLGNPGFGTVDEGCQATCTDTDGDGYGSPASSTCAHTQLDCNNNNAAIFPGATEICDNSIDEDCNGADLACPVNYPINVKKLQILDGDGKNITKVSPGSQYVVNATNQNGNAGPLTPMQIIFISRGDVPIQMIAITGTIHVGETSDFSGMFTMPANSLPGTYTAKVFSWNHWASQAGWQPYSETKTMTFTVQ